MVDVEVTLRNRVGIVENENGSFKADAMFTGDYGRLLFSSHSNRITCRDTDRISGNSSDVNTCVRTLFQAEHAG